jgi:hypothetical protein
MRVRVECRPGGRCDHGCDIMAINWRVGHLGFVRQSLLIPAEHVHRNRPNSIIRNEAKTTL